jgi:hypothetical protein
LNALYLSTIAAVLIAVLTIGVYALVNPEADDSDNMIIEDVKVQPSTIDVGDTFVVNMTLINNSPNPIYIEHGVCEALSVIFDNHVAVNKKNVICESMAIIQKLNPNEKITETIPNSYATYSATSSGTVNATAIFSYMIRNQTDHNPLTTAKTISKSFSFVIYDNSTTRTVNETDSSMIKIPEFQFTVPVLVASVVSMMLLYRIRFRK